MTQQSLILLPLTLLAGAALLAGCQREVTEKDIESAEQEYRQAVHDAHETLVESQEEVSEKLQEAQEAEAQLEHTQQQYREEQARKEFIQQQEAEIQKIHARVESLRAEPGTQTERQQQVEEHLGSIENQLQNARDGLEEVKSADLDEWMVKKPAVTAPLDQARQELQLVQSTM